MWTRTCQLEIYRHFDELNCLYSQRANGYSIPHNADKKTISINTVSRGKAINNGSEVVKKEKLKYPVNINANPFSVSLPCLFCHHLIPATNPSKHMKLNPIIKSMARSIRAPDNFEI